MPVPVTPKTEAQLLEVFSSIQGEGLLIGCLQIFLRFALCNLDCSYCDTPFAPADDCRIEDAPGSGQFRTLPNPVSLETLTNILSAWCGKIPGLHHSISLTGGEPLVQLSSLLDWVPALAEILPLHLETNGTLPDALEPLLPHLEWISMDIKLASMSGTPTPWQAHSNFLALARDRNCLVKVVVGEETAPREVENAARMVHEVGPDVPLILQPVTRDGRVGFPARALLDLQERAAQIHPHLRVIPQTHQFMGLL
ncbi:MAG: radical SAM protein [Desulfuromonas sp.]|nr:MAG: radical SAM protein [Desulfuromonas sp.]